MTNLGDTTNTKMSHKIYAVETEVVIFVKLNIYLTLLGPQYVSY